MRITSPKRKPSLACVMTIIASLASPIHSVPSPAVAYAEEPITEQQDTQAEGIGEATIEPTGTRVQEVEPEAAPTTQENTETMAIAAASDGSEEEAVAYPAYDEMATFIGSDEDEARMPSVRVIADEGALPEGTTATVTRDQRIESEAIAECSDMFADNDDMTYEAEAYGFSVELGLDGEVIAPEGDIRLVVGIRPDDHDHVIPFRRERGKEGLSRQDALIDEERDRMLTVVVPPTDAGLPIAVTTVREHRTEHADANGEDDGEGDSDDEGDRPSLGDESSDMPQGDSHDEEIGRAHV